MITVSSIGAAQRAPVRSRAHSIQFSRQALSRPFPQCASLRHFRDAADAPQTSSLSQIHSRFLQASHSLSLFFSSKRQLNSIALMASLLFLFLLLAQIPAFGFLRGAYDVDDVVHKSCCLMPLLGVLSLSLSQDCSVRLFISTNTLGSARTSRALTSARPLFVRLGQTAVIEQSRLALLLAIEIGSRPP